MLAMPSFTGFCQALLNVCPALGGNRAIKQPLLSFLLERGDISNQRLLIVSSPLLGYTGAKFDTLQKL